MDLSALSLLIALVGPPPPERVSVANVEDDAAVEGPADTVEGPEVEAVEGPEVEDDEVEDDEVEDDGVELGDKKKKDKKTKTKLGARVVAGVRMKQDAAAVDSEGEVVGEVDKRAELQLRQARVKFMVEYRKVLTVRVSADFADLLGSPDPGEVVRDAWGNIEIHPAFQIKVGNFKRPYSRFELRGVSKIPVVGRGLYNSYAVENLSWGDRAVGASFWGEVEPERRGLQALGWAVMVSNDAIAGAPPGVDVHARVNYEPTPWLAIDAGGAFKYVQDPLANETACRTEWTRAPGCRRSVFGATASLKFRVAGLYASVETNLAQDWLFADTSPWMLGALAYATYDFEVAKRTRLQPVVFGEFVDANLSFAQSEAVRAVAGLNVLWTKHLRVMPQVEWVKPLPPVTAFNPFAERWSIGLWVSVQL
ncbi:MAG: hypothetical protein KC636_35360 [Myxococcales bacterium]|nr:hypothetical protein [Myxococcales bacterium]